MPAQPPLTPHLSRTSKKRSSYPSSTGDRPHNHAQLNEYRHPRTASRWPFMRDGRLLLWRSRHHCCTVMHSYPVRQGYFVGTCVCPLLLCGAYIDKAQCRAYIIIIRGSRAVIHKRTRTKRTKGEYKRANTRQSRDTVDYTCDGAKEISVSLPPTTQG